MRTVPFGKSFTWLLSISGRLLSVKNPSFFNQELLNPTDIGNLLFFCNFLIEESDNNLMNLSVLL